MGAKDLRGYDDSLVSDGEYCFTTSQAVVSIGKSRESVRAGIRYLRRERLIATPSRGFHVIVPLEYRSTVCPPASFFIDQMFKRRKEDNAIKRNMSKARLNICCVACE